METNHSMEGTIKAQQATTAWCPDCQSHALMIGPLQAAYLSGSTPREIVKKAERRELHSFELPNRGRLLCLASLSQWMRRSAAPTQPLPAWPIS